MGTLALLPLFTLLKESLTAVLLILSSFLIKLIVLIKLLLALSFRCILIFFNSFTLLLPLLPQYCSKAAGIHLIIVNYNCLITFVKKLTMLLLSNNLMQKDLFQKTNVLLNICSFKHLFALEHLFFWLILFHTLNILLSSGLVTSSSFVNSIITPLLVCAFVAASFLLYTSFNTFSSSLQERSLRLHLLKRLCYWRRLH